jgi:mono/diheme cytochrome c family protein
MAALASICALQSACDRPPSADSLREWTPADHHSSDDDKLGKLGEGTLQAAGRTAARPKSEGKSGGNADQPGQGASGGADVAQLVDITWRQQCAVCHGSTGKGDGQMGPMVRAPDLTRDDWQTKVSDGDIASAIQNGKGKMPKFEVPAAVVSGLVARVRAVRGR